MTQKLEKVGWAEHNTVGSWSAELGGSRLPHSLSETLNSKVCLQTLTRLLAMLSMKMCAADSHTRLPGCDWRNHSPSLPETTGK